MTALKADVRAARAAVSGATQKAAGQQTITRKEAGLRDNLVSLIKKVPGEGQAEVRYPEQAAVERLFDRHGLG